jgi:hypothetical protein
MATLLDSYSETNQSDLFQLCTGIGYQHVGQSFTGNANYLVQCKFYLAKYGSPTGNITASLYAHTGTYGTSSKPTGGALATSDNIDVSTLTTSLQLITFTFSTPYLMSATYFCIELEYTGGDVDNQVLLGYDNTSPTHGGNAFHATSGGYSAESGSDCCFYVYINDTATFSVSDTIVLADSSLWQKIKTFSVSSTLALTESITNTVFKIFSVSDTLSLAESITNTIVKKFSNLSKNIFSWINQDKTL